MNMKYIKNVKCLQKQFYYVFVFPRIAVSSCESVLMNAMQWEETPAGSDYGTV